MIPFEDPVGPIEGAVWPSIKSLIPGSITKLCGGVSGQEMALSLSLVRLIVRDGSLFMLATLSHSEQLT